ncbi:transglutaminase family protein [Fulvivirga sp. M361]|uniref:transglutaminase family protein n=1 Tax=Fulvivirga sp. M361 TaxID=2594266 RepID=UPI00117ABBFB|nr:transglutaminase family protein [Fulvivirga sp. M361]TRX49196.1 transglutaminase family protein [Fulvivirga sp. M361]
MRLNIRHNTLYSYSKTVFLEPHYLLMYPLQRPYVTVEHISFDISPQPLGTADVLDIFNNPTKQIWFAEMQNMLHIEVDMVLSLEPFNPFTFLPFPEVDLSHSELYAFEKTHALNPFLRYDEEMITEDMKTLLSDMVAGARNDIIATLTNLLGHIHKNWDHSIRLHPDVWSSDECYNKKKGSCRDLAWMMMIMLRYLKLATRFVSGYSFNPEQRNGHELHAWLEVFIPGGGWIGVDPSLGLFATDHFVPLAVGSEPKFTMPVNGSYRGSAISNMESTVTIRKMD